MKGMELARAFYDEYGAPMLREQFPELMGHIAVGLAGSGSECYGYDDTVSEDHDFEPGFCIFLPGEDVVDTRAQFRLARAYAALPDEYCGYRRSRVSPVGGSRHGVIRAADFWREKTGSESGVPDADEWLRIPEYALAEAVNGEIFYDGDGAFSRTRRGLRHYPAGIRAKKLAGYLFLMAQAGGYNYPRCLAHGESGAAQLAVGEYVRAAMHAVFLLNDRYMPYYKWSFRAMRDLSILAPLWESLEYLLTTDNEPGRAAVKKGVISDIDRSVEAAVRAAGLAAERVREPGVGLALGTAAVARAGTEGVSKGRAAAQGSAGEPTGEESADLERLAYAVNDSIEDGYLRNLHILAGTE